MPYRAQSLDVDMWVDLLEKVKGGRQHPGRKDLGVEG